MYLLDASHQIIYNPVEHNNTLIQWHTLIAAYSSAQFPGIIEEENNYRIIKAVAPQAFI